MSTKLYVGNLAYTTNSPDLEALFGEAGTVVSASVITDKMSGQSRGFGFVEMSSSEEARAAIERFDGYELQGRNLKVNEAKPVGSRSGDRGSGYGRGGRDRRW
jgi:RNA recognition motif-containing protein